MPSIPRGQENTSNNINWFTSINNVKVDMFLVEFQIFYIGGGLPGTQVFPATGWEDVTSAPGRFAEGSYYAYDNTLGQGWTPDVTADVGQYRIYWRWKYLSTSSYQTDSEDFTVEVESTGSPGTETMYCSVQDMRDEGVPDSGYGAVTDARLTTLIQRASRLIDMYTGRWFEPRTMTFSLDAQNAMTLFIEQPIISISSVSIDGIALVADDYKVYNRHITQNLIHPDDRENPKIEIAQPLESTYLFKLGLTWFPRGQQNIDVAGVFGYTDYDGSAEGATPLAIQEACKKMVLRDLPVKYGADPSSDEKAWWRMVRQRTRDQSIDFSDPSKMGHQGVGVYTGDPEIDNILRRYTRPPRIRVV